MPRAVVFANQKMAQSVPELDHITTEAAAQVEKVNRGNLMRLCVAIDVG